MVNYKSHFIFLFFIIFILVFFLSYSLYLTGFLIGGISFEVDPGIKVLDSTFREGAQSTDFLRLNDTQLTRVKDMVLEINDYGKVYFSQEVNLVVDAVENEIDLSSNVLFAENYINVNTSSLTSLNRNALVFFYGLNFIEPGILHNGVPCHPPQCTLLSYVGDELIFNVSNFSYYSAYETHEDTDDPNTDSSSGGGGSSGGGDLTDIEFNEIEVISNVSFVMDKDLFDVNFLIGTSSVEYLEITNNGQENLVLEFSLTNALKRFLSLDELFVSLEVNETKKIPIFFSIREDELGGVYTGMISIKAGGVIKNVNVLIGVLDSEALFDVRVDVEDRVLLGEDVIANISIENLGTLEGISVNVTYGVRSFEGDVVSLGEGFFFVEKKLIIERILSLPSFLSPGKYVYFVEVSYGGKIAIASETFIVGENKYLSLTLVLVSLGVLLILIWLIYFFFRKIKKINSIRKIRNMKFD